MNKYYTFLICLLVFSNINAQNNGFDVMLDSIQRLRELSANKNLESNARLLYAKQASELSTRINVDTISIKCNESLSELYWDMKLYDEYRDLNKKNLLLSQRVNDSSAIGKANLNLGQFYRKRTSFRDSAYYYYLHAEKTYNRPNYKYGRAYALYGIAIIKKNEKDFIGSEVNCFQALSLLESLEISDEISNLKSFIYNNLGLTYGQLEIFEKSIEYYKKSLTLDRKLKGNQELSIYITLNNLALTYKLSGQHTLALNHFNRILDNKNLRHKHPDFYVVTLDNYAHTLYLSNKLEQLPSLYLKALKIADSAHAEYESITIHQHLAEYYHDNNKKDSAKYYAYKAKDISQKYYKDDLLKSLLILSKIEEDSIAVKHYASYIKLNDSIQKNERAIRNKFARIQYETDTYIDETKRLATQNILIVIIGLIVFLILALILIIRVQIAKNKILRFESEQQKANEEIYTLMLKQQAKVEEGRLLERHRISEELHDGILNKLLGSRLGLEFLSLDEEDESKKKYSFYINEIQSIERITRDLSHELRYTQLDADKDFITILEDYIGHQSNLHTCQYNIKQNGTIFWKDINDYIKVGLYRIIQEALQNIIKHAKANTISINFSLNSNKLHLDIIDDGIGFNSNQNNDGIGLLNIASRVSKLKGEFKIKSEIRSGTTLAIKVPLF